MQGRPQPVWSGGAIADYDQFRLLVESVTDYAIYMLDRDGCVVSWNPGGQRIKGYTASEIIGQHFSRFYTPEDRAGGLPQRTLEEAAREGRHTAEGWRVRKDGSRFWASVVVDAITATAGWSASPRSPATSPSAASPSSSWSARARRWRAASAWRRWRA